MTDAVSLAADPGWLPHRIDFAGLRVMFLRVEREQLAERGFLANLEERAQKAWMSLDQYAAIGSVGGAPHFVFHSGFCRSTLLIRALNIPGKSVGLNEPGILNSIVKAGPNGRALLRPTLHLLSRAHAGETVIVKPSNYANPLLGSILADHSATRVLLMTDALPVFLSRVASKALIGRVWGRQVFLEMLACFGTDLEMELSACAAMTDLQAAGLGWFLIQREFADLVGSEHRARVRSLHGERFNQSRERTLAAVSSLFDLGLETRETEAITDGTVFRTHAKIGGDFTEREAEAVARAGTPAIDEEIAEVDKWIGKLARQAGIRMPVGQTLF